MALIGGHHPDYHQRYLNMALSEARKSPDPNTKVGALFVRNGFVLSAGYNDLPIVLGERHRRLHDRNTKLKLIMHAERNAIAFAASEGVVLYGSTLYVIATELTGALWGGPPCIQCTIELLQLGLERIITLPRKGFSNWKEDLDTAGALLEEAGMPIHEMALEDIL